MQAILLVGGEGTRLRPLTLKRLKSTVPMANRRFLEYPLAYLKQHGVREVVLSVCHKPEWLRKEFGNGRALGMKIHYAVERRPLGTAGAIKNAERFLRSREPVAVLNGDILTQLDLTRMLALHRRQAAVLTLGLTWVDDPSAYGLVLTGRSGQVKRFLEKPGPEEITQNWINAGVYIFNRELFDLIPAGVNVSAERKLFPDLLKQAAPVWGYSSREYWIDIGTPAKYLQAHVDILEGRMLHRPLGKPGKRDSRVWRDHACRIHPGARVLGPVTLGNNCRLEAECQVGELAVLGPQVRVDSGAFVQRSVIWEKVRVGEGARVEGCVVGARSRIGRHAVLRPGTVLGEGSVVPDYSVV